MQLLLVDLAHNSSAEQVDWDYWKSAAKDLAPNHPTLARTLTPEEAVENRSYFQRSAEDLDLLKSLARTLRARRYAIRTEQTYVDWCHRFIGFCGGSNPSTWGPADAERFLPIWRPIGVSRPVPRTRRSMRWCSCFVMSWNVRWTSCASRVPSVRPVCRSSARRRL